MSYDVAIIGGGITGLYCALKLSHLKVILFEANDYFGGRLKTNDTPHFEIGGGRFNEDDKLLCELLHKFNMTFIPLSPNIDYIDKEDGLIPHAKEYYQHLLKQVTANNSEKMREITFYDHCIKILGKERADHLITIHGYIDDMKPFNAYDAINMYKKREGQYFVLKEGFSELCKRMLSKMKITKLLNHKVSNIKRVDDLFQVDDILAKKVIFTIPPKYLKFPILKPLFPLFNSVLSSPLLRIYAQYPEPYWFKGLNSMVTDDVSKHIIPIRDGLIMIAYADGEYIKPFFKNGKMKKISELKKIISDELNNLFPHLTIPAPTYFKPYLWEVGYHSWKSKYNSHKVINTLSSIDGIYICGEAFSLKQGWVEGALLSAEKVVKSIL
jgi:monoamine oxidase